MRVGSLGWEDPWVGKMPGGGYGNPLQYPCLENSMDRGAWQATVHRVAKSNVTEHLNENHDNAQCMQASLMAQQVKNLPAVQETQEMQVQSWVRMIPCRRKMATHSSILA